VWRNRQGNLVRLMSSRSRKGGIALAGWEKATRNLP